LKKNEIENQKEFQGENKGNPEGNLGEKPKEKPEEKTGENPGGNLVKNLEEVKVEEKKEEKKEENKIISNVNTGNANYKEFSWNNAKFNSNDGNGIKKISKIDNNDYLNLLKINYSIEGVFTVKFAEIYRSFMSGNADLIIVDCNCTEFCKGEVGTVKGKDGTIAYCNGHGQIFILQNTKGNFLNYGEKNQGGKWTLEKQGENGYYVNWHTS